MKIKLDEKNLETALQKVAPKKESEKQGMNRDEEIGFHKGSLNSLLAERNEMVKIIGTIEGIMQAHLKRLQELGVTIDNQTR